MLDGAPADQDRIGHVATVTQRELLLVDLIADTHAHLYHRPPVLAAGATHQDTAVDGALELHGDPLASIRIPDRYLVAHPGLALVLKVIQVHRMHRRGQGTGIHLDLDCRMLGQNKTLFDPADHHFGIDLGYPGLLGGVILATRKHLGGQGKAHRKHEAKAGLLQN